jgi:hypothetical protein
MSEKPKRRWYQFSLRRLLVFAMLVSIGMCWVGVKLCRARKQRIAVEAIVRAGGFVTYDFVMEGSQPRVPAWLLRLLGCDFLFDVSKVSFGDEALVTTLTHLPNLESLFLTDTQVTDVELEHIKGLTNLEVLGLAFTPVTDAGLENLNGLTKLRYLYLTDTQVTNAGLDNIKGLTDLEFLDLSGTRVTDAGLDSLNALSGLGVLGLDDTQVSDAGIEHLKTFANLELLSVTGTQVTDAGVKELKEALPNVQIYR